LPDCQPCVARSSPKSIERRGEISRSTRIGNLTSDSGPNPGRNATSYFLHENLAVSAGERPIVSPPKSADAVSSPEQESARWFADHIQVHDSALKSYLRRSFPRARGEVDDVVQESYLRIWRARAGQPLKSAKAFLFTVARRVALDLLRHKRASPINDVGNFPALPVLDEREDVVDLVSREEKIRLLAQALATLPPRGREVVILRKLKGLSQKEVSSQLNLSEKTVDEHLYRGMKRLGHHLRERGARDYYDR
jgi:RNA polymerase sigma factor (sigma-70 family)